MAALSIQGRPYLQGTDETKDDPQLESNSRGYDAFQLAWDPSTGAVTYRVTVEASGTTTTVTTTELTATVSGLVPDTLYKVNVTAINGNDSTISADRLIWTRPPTPHRPYLVGTASNSDDQRPSDPITDEPSSRGPQTFRLTWDSVASATAYQLSVDGLPSAWQVSPGDEIPPSGQTLQPNTLYVITVRAIGAGGLSFPSPSRSVYTRPATPKPPFLAGTNGSSATADDPLADLVSRGPDYFDLSTETVSGVELYEFQAVGHAPVGSSTPTSRVNGLAENVKFDVGVRIDDQDVGGKSFWSLRLAARSYITRPPTVPGFRRKDFDPVPRGLTLQWDGLTSFNDIQHVFIVGFR